MEYPILVTAAFLAGLLNAVAGGGSFFTFPTLVFLGVPPKDISEGRLES